MRSFVCIVGEISGHENGREIESHARRKFCWFYSYLLKADRVPTL